MSDAVSANQTLARDAMPLLDRMESMGKETLVLRAIRKCEPGNKSGNANKCWELDAHTRFECAKMHIVDFKSAQVIHDHMGERMGTVARRSLTGWLKSVRIAYGELHTAQLTELEQAESLAYQSGDLVAILGLIFASIAPKFVSIASGMGGDSSPEMLHVFLRFLDISTTAAKVQAGAKHDEAKTQKVLLDISKMVRGLNKEGGNKKTAEEIIQLVGDAVDSVMGVGGGK